MTTEQLKLDADAVERRRTWRDAMAMVLYLSIVLLAELAALPTGHDGAGGAVRGPVGWELVAIVWGTTIGLAFAHWSPLAWRRKPFVEDRLPVWDRLQALSELAGGVRRRDGQHASPVVP